MFETEKTKRTSLWSSWPSNWSIINNHFASRWRRFSSFWAEKRVDIWFNKICLKNICFILRYFVNFENCAVPQQIEIFIANSKITALHSWLLAQRSVSKSSNFPKCQKKIALDGKRKRMSRWEDTFSNDSHLRQSSAMITSMSNGGSYLSFSLVFFFDRIITRYCEFFSNACICNMCTPKWAMKYVCVFNAVIRV